MLNDIKKPLIGIILDKINIEEEEEQAKWYSKYNWYAMRYRYHDVLVQNGAIPLFIGYADTLIDDYINLFDGLLMTGGHFDHDPALYNEKNIHYLTKLRKERSHFEYNFLKKFLTTNKPFLGICGGMQMLNIVNGGSLYQHLVDNDMYNKIMHTASDPTISAHDIEIVPNTLLSSLVNQEKYPVNTSHHQGVKDLGDNIIASAYAPDGLVEAIELKGKKFCLGVEWHPEYLISDLDLKIFQKFITSCN